MAKEWTPKVGDVVQFRTPEEDELNSNGIPVRVDIGTPKAYGMYAVITNTNGDSISLGYFSKEDLWTVQKSAWFSKECFNLICHYNDIFNIVANQYEED